MKQKIIKIKIGDTFDGTKNNAVFLTAWPDKEGNYSIKLPVFINEVEVKEHAGKAQL